MKKSRRILRILLLVVLLCGLLTMSVLAADGEGDEPRMFGTFWALIPPLVAIVLALITKEAYSALFVGVVLGAVMVADCNFMGTVDTITVDALTAAVADNSGILLFLVFLGIVVALVNKSGASYFFSPLGGYNDKENGMFPLWYKNPNGFYTLPYCRSEDRGRVTTFVPPLMSWYESSKDGSSKTRLLMGTYGHDVETGGSTSQDWLFPLYSYDGDFKTLLFGRKTGAQSADYWWLTPLVGTTTGETTGLWVAPLVSWSSDSKVARLEKMMDSSRLDASIVGKMRKSVKRDKNGSRTNEVFMVENQRGGEKLQFGLGMVGCKRTIHLDGGQNDAHCGLWQGSSVKKKAGKRWCQGEKKTVSFYEKAEFGFRLLFGGERQRVVNFDYDTKKKVFDGEVDESDSLYGLLWSSRKEKFGGRSDAKQSLFWRLYHRDEKDGNATTDIFPFITYDERKDGYTKTSFLWRFFRYEDDPKTGTSLDLFFIPFKRP